MRWPAVAHDRVDKHQRDDSQLCILSGAQGCFVSGADGMGLIVTEQSEQIQVLHRTIRTIRSVVGVAELPAAWVDVLLVVALKPALPLSLIEEGSGLPSTTVQRALLALGATERLGKPGPGLIEGIADPRHGARKLYFLTAKGRTIMAEILSAMTGKNISVYDAPTGSEYLARFETEAGDELDELGYVDPKAFTAQTVTVGKRALLRRGEKVGSHVVAFPLAPASKAIKAIEAWTREQGGTPYQLPSIAKPDGMVIVDLPHAELQVAFHLRWRGPIQASDLDESQS